MVLADKQLQSIALPNVLVAGDVMLDRYWFGDVERISPEAPVPVVSVTENTERLGGAGNVALNVTSLGGRCTLLGIIGDDEAGETAERTAKDAGVQHKFIVDPLAPTSIKQRIISRNQQLIRADFEGQPNDESTRLLVEEIAESLNAHDVLVLSDYGKGSLKMVEKILTVAKQHKTPVLVDPKGSDFSRYSGATMITPNLNEFELVAGKIGDDSDFEAKAMDLIRTYNVQQLLVTLSDKGMKLFDRDSPSIHSPARSREVYDVSGAGDTVIAVMAMCMAANFDPGDAMSVANSAAGVVVSKLGTATATMQELKTAITRDAGK